MRNLHREILKIFWRKTRYLLITNNTRLIINAPFFLKTSNYPITFCAFLLYESVKVQTIFFAAAFIFYKKLTTPFLQTKIIIKQIKKILRLVFFYKNKTLIQV